MNPQSRAEKFMKRKNVNRLFARASIVAAVDSRLSDRAHRVLTLLSGKGISNPEVEAGMEEIAWALNCSKAKAKRCVKELVSLHYVIVRRAHNLKNVYVLAGFESPATGKTQGQRSSTVVVCKKCSQIRKSLALTGLCRTCTANAVLAERVRWAQSELGATATPEQIAAHLKNATLARRIRRILERGITTHEGRVVEPVPQFAVKEAS